MKKYFFDDSFFTFSENVIKISGKVNKKDVVIKSDPELDYVMVSSFSSTVIKGNDGKFYFYYTTVSEKFDTAIGLAVSSDGLKWEKPMLGQVYIGGGNTNRIKLEGIPEGISCLQPSVIRMSEHSWRLYCWLFGDKYCRYVACDSCNGLNWKVISADRPVIYHPVMDKKHEHDERIGKYNLFTNDNTFTYYNEEKNIFTMYSVWLFNNYPETGCYVPHDNARTYYRVIQYRESQDGLAWANPEIILTPDSTETPDTQFYYLTKQSLGEWTIGMLGIYKAEAQTMDIELVSSLDGIRWQRPLKGTPFIKRELEQELGMVNSPHHWIDCEDKILFYYSGHKHVHNARILGKSVSSAIMLGEIEKDRVIAVTPRIGVGEIQTKPFIINDSRPIIVNAKLNGKIRCELTDPFGKVYEGFSFGDCNPVSGDSSSHRLSWKNDLNSLVYKAVKLKLSWDNGELYTLMSL